MEKKVKGKKKQEKKRGPGRLTERRGRVTQTGKKSGGWGLGDWRFWKHKQGGGTKKKNRP